MKLLSYLLASLLLLGCLKIATCIDPQQAPFPKASHRDLFLVDLLCLLVKIITFGIVDLCNKNESSATPCELFRQINFVHTGSCPSNEDILFIELDTNFPVGEMTIDMDGSDDYDSKIVLLNEMGELVDEDDDGEGDCSLSRLDSVTLSAGSYALVVSELTVEFAGTFEISGTFFEDTDPPASNIINFQSAEAMETAGPFILGPLPSMAPNEVAVICFKVEVD